MRRERKLVSDSSIKGWVCNACGWAWPTPRWVAENKTSEQALKQDFDSHRCSEYPLPPKEELRRIPGWEADEAERRRATVEADLRRIHAEERAKVQLTTEKL